MRFSSVLAGAICLVAAVDAQVVVNRPIGLGIAGLTGATGPQPAPTTTTRRPVRRRTTTRAIPTTTLPVDCGSPVIPNGFVSQGSTVRGSELDIYCDAGFFLTMTDATIVCQANGQWNYFRDDPSLYCRRVVTRVELRTTVVERIVEVPATTPAPSNWHTHIIILSVIIGILVIMAIVFFSLIMNPVCQTCCK